MNPLQGCSKGHKKCIKTCQNREKCHSCPYLKECCHRYCITLPTRSAKADPFLECIESFLKEESVL